MPHSGHLAQQQRNAAHVHRHAALHDAAVPSLLQHKIGLTRREADLVEHRHRKQTGTLLGLAELEETIALLPDDLLDGHVAELLRSTTLSTLPSSAVPCIFSAAAAAAAGVANCTVPRPLPATCARRAGRAGFSPEHPLLR